MLLLNLDRIRAAEERFEHVYPPETFAVSGGAEEDPDTMTVAAPTSLAFAVFKDKDRFRLVGRVETMVELVCGRCLEPFLWPIDGPFDLRYQPRREATSEADLKIEEDDFSTAFYENDAIDLVQLMREQFYLALPMKPLCRPDCRGLCPRCGTNLNRDTCACTSDWIDPRFAALKKLRTN
jgi:DUF177 domain-containing protein